MGTFYADIGVGHPLGGDFLPVSALVDTGSTHSVMPESLLASLSLAPMERRTYRIADGSFIQRDVGEARFRIDNRERTCTVIFGSEGQYLLGATTLEDFDLMVDPTRPIPASSP
ncbi:MAG: aspartyl protease family protein [Chloroflexota bacterium]|nr:aspartyl protease family protein [Chloroflexota bacterium]MDE2684108.1 aspartyl protease family protein [Chloroflexota bacterium]